MDSIKTGNKGRHLNIFEKYYINRISSDNLHMNDINTDIYNPIFQTLHELHAREQHAHTQ
jgi:hypothetical protein